MEERWEWEERLERMTPEERKVEEERVWILRFQDPLLYPEEQTENS